MACLGVWLSNTNVYCIQCFGSLRFFITHFQQGVLVPQAPLKSPRDLPNFTNSSTEAVQTDPFCIGATLLSLGKSDKEVYPITMLMP